MADKKMNPTLKDMRLEKGAYLIGNFDGKDRYIRFDLNAFAEMENIYGDMEQAEAKLAEGSIKEIRRILWIGLIWDEAILDDVTGEPIGYKITPYQVGTWLDTSNMSAVIKELTMAINASLPEEEKTTTTNVTPITKHALAAAGEEPDPN